MASITLQGIQKHYGEVHALRPTDLEISDHEFLVLVGPSGSGKTTLLRVIAGLETATGGDIYFGARNVTNVDVRNRDIAMVFQNYGLYPHMTVFGNMAFGLRRRHMPGPAVIRKVSETAKLLGIEQLLTRKPRQLSGGQRQRVALGRAIVRDPEVFLLDEPLSNLDAHLRVQMRTEILKVHRAVTATAVYVTHDQVEAMTMGDRIAVMRDGVIQQLGTPDELYDRPVNQFVAGFIGTPAMGFLTCERAGAASAGLTKDGADLASEPGGQLWQGAGIRVALPAPLAAAVPAEVSKVVIGIRPERFTPASPGGVSSAACVVEGTVEVVEPLGSDQHIVVRCGDTTVTVRRPREDRVERDEKVTYTVDSAHLHVFNAETGQAFR